MSLKKTLCFAALVLAASCAKQQEPINRVQPNYFDKSFFVGADYLDATDDPEFYSQATLIDVGYGAGQDGLFTSTYAQPLTRVKWTIQENLLIARLAYERIQDSDGKGARARRPTTASWWRPTPSPATSTSSAHYNPSTGEQLNVIEENTTDRPWNERQYIRVDWSKNLSTDNYDFDTLSMMGVFGGVTYEPLAYYVNDPTGRRRAALRPEARATSTSPTRPSPRPQLIDLSMWGIGAFPACFLDADVAGGTAPVDPVQPGRAHHSPVVPQGAADDDYEPEDWDGFASRRSAPSPPIASATPATTA